ncbi:MAG: hypothetical protein ABI847_03075, partial [Anaerolineales bacterium]
MPTPLDPDGPTAWVRGDLPDEMASEPAAPPEPEMAAETQPRGEPEAPLAEAEASGSETEPADEPEPALAEAAEAGLAETLEILEDLAEEYG